MLNIKQEIEILLLRSGVVSMRKLLSKMLASGYKVPKPSTMSVQLNRKRIRFETVQEILDFLGYELIIREKQN